MKRKIVSLYVFFTLLIFSVPTEAIISESINAGINALNKYSDEEERTNAEEFIKLVAKEGDREKIQKDFQKYVKDCREVSISHKDTFEKFILPILSIEKKIPLIDGLLTTGTMKIFMWHYTSSLDDIAKTPAQKKFNEMREHSIDTAQSTFEQMFDAGFDFKDKDPNALEAGLMMLDFEQLKNSYMVSSKYLYLLEVGLKCDVEIIDNGNIFLDYVDLPKVDINSLQKQKAPNFNLSSNDNKSKDSKSESTTNNTTSNKAKPIDPKPNSNANTNTNNEVEAAGETFINYHKAITDKDYRRAYDTLSQDQKQSVGDFNSYVNGFANTISSTVDNLALVGSTNDSYTFEYNLVARDRYQGRVKVQMFNGRVTMAKDKDGWFIRSANSTKTNEYVE